MTIDECKKIIINEILINYNLFDEHEYRSEEVCIKRVKEKWIVFTMSERNSIISESIKEFKDESSGLEEVIKRLKADKILRENEAKKV